MLTSKKRDTVIFYLLVTVVLLPIILLRDYTPSNELRYISIANEALNQGHIFAFTNHGVPYADKPPLYIWLLMATKLIFGNYYHIIISLFSLIPAYVIIETMARWSRLEDKQLMAFRAMMFTCGLLIVSSLTLRMDMLMCMFIVLTLRQFFLIYNSKTPHESWLIPIFIFLGIFTKGPIGIIIPLTSIVAFLIVKGRCIDFFKYLGWRTWGLLFVLLGLWFFAVYQEGGRDYLNNLLFNQTINRTIHSFHHSEPFYYYLYMMWPLLLPWSFFIARFVIKVYKSNKVMDNTICLLLITTFSSIGILSLISSKISIYFLPVVPFAVALTATEIPMERPTKWTIWTLGFPTALFALSVPGIAIMVWLFKGFDYLNDPMIWAGATALSAISIFTLVRIKRVTVCDTIFSISAGIMAMTFLIGFSMPKLNSYLGYKNLCVEALTLSQKYKTTNYVAYHVGRCSNMDVFLDKQPTEIYSAKELSSYKSKNAIVIMAKEHQDSIKLTNSVVVGNNIVGLYR